MLSASKLYQSVSTSGPSATTNPIPTNTSSNSRCVEPTSPGWPTETGTVTALTTTSPRSKRSDSSATARAWLERMLLRASRAASTSRLASCSNAPASARATASSCPSDFCSAERIERFPVINGSASFSSSRVLSDVTFSSNSAFWAARLSRGEVLIIL